MNNETANPLLMYRGSANQFTVDTTGIYTTVEKYFVHDSYDENTNEVGLLPWHILIGICVGYVIIFL